MKETISDEAQARRLAAKQVLNAEEMRAYLGIGRNKLFRLIRTFRSTGSAGTGPG